jgi:hypothetical protein
MTVSLKDNFAEQQHHFLWGKKLEEGQSKERSVRKGKRYRNTLCNVYISFTKKT